LLDNEKRRIELLYGILLSLPGSPFLYYGDELGMGDHYLLNDRDGVRTPMQWAAEPRAGFSSAHPDEFYIPLVGDPGYTATEINVNAQRADGGSLLHFVRNLLAIRRQNPLLGVGTFEIINSHNPAILAYRRQADDGGILVLGNFSTTAQTADLARLTDETSIDLVSGRQVGGRLGLSPHEFVWLALP
jgi:maltose alpha-D-glucosyltransferase/alpha-amylase